MSKKAARDGLIVLDFEASEANRGRSVPRKSHELYQRTTLGYREERRSVCPHIDGQARISLLFDFKVHKMSIKQLVPKYHMNYLTIRHILAQYYMFGLVQQRKYRMDGR